MTWGLGGFGAFVGTACRNPSQEPKVCIGFMAGLRRINRELVGKLMSMLPSFEPHQLRANNPSAGAWRMETRWFLGTCKRFIHHTSEKCPRRFLSIPREGTATSPQHGSEPVQYLDRRTVVVFWVFLPTPTGTFPFSLCTSTYSQQSRHVNDSLFTNLTSWGHRGVGNTIHYGLPSDKS